MKILGIETSCDETAVAVFEMKDIRNGAVLAERLSSQVDLHALYGGVVPELAAREHLRSLPLMVETVLNEAGVALSGMDCIGVTRGPGLKGCLLMGLSFAKAIHLAIGVPLVGVNHIEGHALAPLMDNPGLTYPCLLLIVSGGHTELVYSSEPGRYALLERTIDDAAGEAFDKSANLLGLSYPGGAALAALADSFGPSTFTLPRVMREAEGFSFSGLKTAISQLVKRHEGELYNNKSLRADIASAVQESIIDALLFKVKKAVRSTGISTVAVTGGVAANKALRSALESLSGVTIFYPEHKHCTDNGAMIAYAAGFRALRGDTMPLGGEVYPRWPLETLL